MADNRISEPSPGQLTELRRSDSVPAPNTLAQLASATVSSVDQAVLTCPMEGGPASPARVKGNSELLSLILYLRDVMFQLLCDQQQQLWRGTGGCDLNATVPAPALVPFQTSQSASRQPLPMLLDPCRRPGTEGLMVTLPASAKRDRTSAVVLLVSVALNLFFSGCMGCGGHPTRFAQFDAPRLEPSRTAAERIDRLAATLPASAADKLQTEFRCWQSTVEAAHAAYRAAQQRVRMCLRNEPFDP